ncbi:MAG: hypothetical protein IPG50_27915 [Myxococcales bacterium]|nr:hypothetical protein [Myxococcales bacterium]
MRAFTEVIERAGTTTHEQRYKAMAMTELGVVAFDAGERRRRVRSAIARSRSSSRFSQARRAEVADAMSLVGRAALEQQETTVAIEFLEPACDIYGGCKGDVRARHAAALHPLALARAAVGRTDEARSALERPSITVREVPNASSSNKRCSSLLAASRRRADAARPDDAVARAN